MSEMMLSISSDDLRILTLCTTAWVAAHQQHSMAAKATEVIKRVGELENQCRTPEPL